VTNLSFANPSAFLQAQIELPNFLGSLTVAQGQHRAIIGAIEMREGFRAEALAREHARLARENLDFVLQDERMIERVPALSLVAD
jgi:GntR family transcriptional regulator of vanillate catabolism